MVIFSMQASLANRYIQIWMHLVSVFCTSPNEDFWCYRFGCTRWYALGLLNFGETLYSDLLSLRMSFIQPQSEDGPMYSAPQMRNLDHKGVEGLISVTS